MSKSLLRNTILALFLTIGGWQTAYATHIIGGEMNYKCLGNDQYEISLTVYRDCFLGEAPLDDTAYVAAYNIDGQLVQTLPILLGHIDTINQVDACLVIPPNICVETTTYVDTITLQNRVGGYRLVYQRCCRNGTILNIVDPLNTGATYDILLSETAMATCNSSPVLSEWPPTFVCVNRPLKFNSNATDIDGDSIAYRLCAPLRGSTTIDNPRPRPAMPPPYTKVTWNTPTYDLNNLLGGIPLKIDSKTGVLTGTPNLIGQFVVGVCVDEFRNGVLISTTRRDFQYNVIPCEDVVAKFDLPTIQCEDLTVVPQNRTEGEPEGFLWKFFDNSGRILGTSSEFDPSYTFPDTGNYTVRLIVNPTSICVDSSEQTILLKTNPLTADFQYKIEGCTDSLVLAITHAFTQPIGFIEEVSWSLLGDMEQKNSTERTPTFILKNNQFIELSLTINPNSNCPKKVTKSFRVSLLEDIALADSLTICQGESIGLNPSEAFPNYVYNWSPTQSLDNPNAINPLSQPSQTTTYQVSYSDSTQLCQSDQFITLIVRDTLPAIDADIQVACDGQTVQIFPNSNELIRYDFGDNSLDVIAATDSFITHNYKESGDFLLQMSYEAETVCGDSITKMINLPGDNISPKFEWNVEACNNNIADLELIDLSTSFSGKITERNWQLSNGLTSMEEEPVFSVNTADKLTATLVITLDDNAVCKDSFQLEIPSLIIEEMVADSLIDCRGTTVNLNPEFNENYTYLWSGLEEANTPNPSIALTTARTFTVQISNEYDCILSDTVFTDAAPMIEISTLEMPIVCDTSEVVLFAESEQTEQLIWTNEKGDTLGFEPELLVIIDHAETFTATFTDSYGCQNSAEVAVNFNPIQLSFDPNQSVCTNESSTLIINNLNPSDDLKFDWSPTADIIEGAETMRPEVQPEESTTFSFTAGNSNGCKAEGAIFVAVLSLPEVSATASPNLIFAGETAQLTATESPNYIYEWQPSNTLDNPSIANPVANPTATTDYRVSITDENGCTSQTTVTVNLREGLCDFPYIFVPSGFTPNGDGENDVLFVRGDFIDELDFVIYDRWGDKVFETTNQDIGWDGTRNGKDLPSGVFGYFLRTVCKNGDRYSRQGNITLIR